MLIYDIYVFVDSKFVATNWKEKKKEEKTLTWKRGIKGNQGKGERQTKEMKEAN